MKRSAMRGSLATRKEPRISRSLSSGGASRRPVGSIRATSYLLFAILVCLPAAAQTPQEFQKLAEQAIHRLDLQTELPHEPEPPHFSIKLPSEVLWVVIVLAIGMLAYAFRD